MTIEVTSKVLALLQAAADAARPHECCGILLGKDRGRGRSERIDAATPAINVHPDPARHFEIDPRALIAAHRAAREGGPQVIGYYHSHPQGPARPSATDIALANGDGSGGDGSVWAIIGTTGGTTFWRNGERGFVALSYTVVHG